MTKKELEVKHPTYVKYSPKWAYYTMAYKGDDEFIESAIGSQNSRESNANYRARLNAGIGFNYCGAIVDLFNFYLTEKPTTRDLKDLENDPQWKMFLDDADLNGVNFNEWSNEAQKLASVSGAIGILVSKAHTGAETIKEEIDNRIYPYCAAYLLVNIFDWAHDVNPDSGRPRLSYLKLKNNDGTFLVWTLNAWEVFEIMKDGTVNSIESGMNPLGEIPFIWMTNLKDLTLPNLGVSDLNTIARIVASIVRDLSYGDEIIKFAGFPMMRKPMRRDGDEGKEDLSGVKAVQEFDPSLGTDGKPDWMETVILEPIEAILKWIDRKTDEIYRVVHLSGVHGQRKSNNEVASGLALRYEFQQLTSVLSKKAENAAEAERSIIRFWLMWQNKIESFKDVTVRKSKSFSVDDMSANLDNLLKSMGNVLSDTFNAQVQKRIARLALPDMPDDTKSVVDVEIDIGVKKTTVTPPDETDPPED